MYIDRIFYPVKTLGYGNRIGIWTQGCPRRCKNCSNPELWQQKAQNNIQLEHIKSIIFSIKGDIDGVTITGGDPFMQLQELNQLVEFINENVSEDILIYTGYTIEELLSISNSQVNTILSNIAVLIDGAYIDELNDNKALRGSSNQKIIFMKEKYKSRYKKVIGEDRKVQNIFYGDKLFSIGIPMDSYRCKIKEKLSYQGVDLHI